MLPISLIFTNMDSTSNRFETGHRSIRFRNFTYMVAGIYLTFQDLFIAFPVLQHLEAYIKSFLEDRLNGLDGTNSAKFEPLYMATGYFER